MLKVEINPPYHTFQDTLEEIKEKYRNSEDHFALIVPTSRIIDRVRDELFEEFDVLYNIHILTFDDLFKKTDVDDIIIRLVIDLAIQQAIDEEKLPKQHFFESKGFRDLTQQYISLFKNNLKTTREIKEITPGSSLHYISIIYAYYEKIKEEYQLLDRYDKYFVEENTIFFKEVIIEGFYDFRPIEYKVLERLSQTKTKLTIRFRADVLDYQDTIERLQLLGAKIDRSPYKKEVYPEVQVFSCDDKFLEIKKTAIEILREYHQGMPFHEMAIIVPDEEYMEYISYVFEESNIPIADKIKESILKYQIIRDFKSLLEAEDFHDFFHEWAQIKSQEINDPVFQSFTEMISQVPFHTVEDLEKKIDILSIDRYKDYWNEILDFYRLLNREELLDYFIEAVQLDSEKLDGDYKEEIDEFIHSLIEVRVKFDPLLKKSDLKKFIIDFISNYKISNKIQKKKAVSILTLLDARLFTYEMLIFVGMTDQYYPPMIKEDFFYHEKNIALLKSHGIEIKSSEESRKNNDKNFLVAINSARKKIKYLYSLEENQKSIYLKPIEDRIEKYTLKDYIKPKVWISRSDLLKRTKSTKLQNNSKDLCIEAEKTPIYSASSLECFQMCPMKYYYRYLLKIKTEELPRAIRIGQVIHDALEKYYKKRMTKDFIIHQSHPNYEEFDTIFLEEFNHYEFDRMKPEDEILFRYYQQRLRDFLKEDLTQLKKRGYYPFQFEEVLINKSFTHNGRTFVLTGRIDRLDRNANGHLELIDYKLSRNSFRTTNDFKNNKTLQFPIYMLWENVQSCRYISIRDNESKVFMDWSKEKSTKEEFNQEVLDKITSLIERIEACDFFHGTDQPSNCKNCDYRNICRVRVVNI